MGFDHGWDTKERSYSICSVASVFKMLGNLRRFFCLFSFMLLEVMGIRPLKTHSHVFKPKGFADWNIFLEFVTCWPLLDREGQVKRVQERVVMGGREGERGLRKGLASALCHPSHPRSTGYHRSCRQNDG